MRTLRPSELVADGASLFRSTTLANSWTQPLPARSVTCAPWRALGRTRACLFLHQGVEFQSFLTCKMQSFLLCLPSSLVGVNRLRMDLTGNSIRCSVMTYMGTESRREWIYIYVWLIHFAVQQKLTQHCKATILQ